MIKKFDDFLSESKKETNLVFYGHKNVNKEGGEYFNAIYASTFGTKMHGSGQIYQLTFTIAPDKKIEDRKAIEYWGWKDDSGRISMIFPAYFLFDMCFPAGAKKAEEDGDGERVKLILVGAEIFHEKKLEDEKEKRKKQKGHKTY